MLDHSRNSMAGGGDAPSVPIWDMAVLAGATLFISTLVIVSPWTQPDSYDLDGKEDVLSVHTGMSQAGLTFEATCVAKSAVSEGSCNKLSAWVLPHDGQEIWDGSLDQAEEIVLLEDGNIDSTVDMDGKLDSGEYRIILDGDGSYTFEVTVNRTIPHEFFPAIIGSFLLIWGIWRKQQEEDSS